MKLSFVVKIYPYQERIKNLLSLNEKEPLIHELGVAILCSNHLLIDSLRKEISLNQLQEWVPDQNVLKDAEEISLYLPAPPSYLTSPLSWLPKSGFLGKLVQYFVQVVSKSYSLDINSPPKSSWAAQSQLSIIRTMIGDGKWIIELACAYFITIQKTAMAAAGVLISLFGVKKAYSYFQFGVPEILDTNQITNLTSKAQKGELKKALQRGAEMQSLITALTPTSIEKPKIAFLVGKPGVGKTQLVESLALQISENHVPTLSGKKLFSINTASLNEMGLFDENGYSSRLDLILGAIEGCEKEVILFFDEAHNVATPETPSRPGGHLIEVLKTKLLERGISAILATTEEEYERFIAPNKAFVERTEKIQLESMSDEHTKLILKETLVKEQIEVSQDALEKIIELGNTHEHFKERANPRKSFDILQKSSRHLLSWQPSNLRKELEKEEVELRMLQAECVNNQSLIENLKEKSSRVCQLKESLKTQETALRTIHQIRNLKKDAFKKYCSIVHSVPKNPTDDLKRDFLFYKEIFLPTIQKSLANSVAQFEREYGERVPLIIDTPLLCSLYPLIVKGTTS